MASTDEADLIERLDKLEQHLTEENPVLLDVVRGFRTLDRAAYRLGLFERRHSLATDVTWWPLISVLGTFSSGKSTFINRFVGQKLQRTGDQAVDDKFTVICYGPEEKPRTLPGQALDSDPRFNFYKITRELDAIAPGEGQRLDVYLQMKACNSPQLKGRTLIDSPGFDADNQRTAILRITDHVIDLSDLVLVFFDARHPEPGAMRDTLQQLVAKTIQRGDFNKFLYVLNQIDNAAREDNPEEVFAAWQRALAQQGLTAGRFYRLYDPASAVPIPDEARRLRFERKRDADEREIFERIEQVEVERLYRITGQLQDAANSIRDHVVPHLRAARQEWRQKLLRVEGVLLAVVLVAFLGVTMQLGYWDGFRLAPPWWPENNRWLGWVVLAAVLGLAGWVHWKLRAIVGRHVLKRLRGGAALKEPLHDWLCNAFARNVESAKPLFFSNPLGNGRFVKKILARTVALSTATIQKLNDRYLDVSGRRDETADEEPFETQEERDLRSGSSV